MRFSTRSEYGIRVMVRMGRGYGNGPLPLAELAEQEGLPLSYLEQIAGRTRSRWRTSSAAWRGRWRR